MHSLALRTALLWSLAVPAFSQEEAQEAPQEQDPSTGLIVAPGWELVRAYCGACHSYRLVTSQRGDAAFWTDTIAWMQRTQNLAVLDPTHERIIVEYLAGHYDETDWGRRPPLANRLLPLP